MFFVALLAGAVITRRFRRRRITPEASPLTRIEVVLAASCVVLNGLVAVAGIALWREDAISVRPYGAYSGLTVLLDALVLFVAMDFAMYVFHRVAHHPLVFSLAHRTHHTYENPRPLTLFVLSPVEVVGFGALWLVVLTAYTASVEGILIDLSLNLAFGLIGHLGVEPAPEAWLRLPLLRYVSTSTFHAEHHTDRFHNYGFYLLVWDRLFGTLSPDYQADFDRTTRGASTPVVP
jgi:sterol desaturase/sphingolipid hydroxylase (fatty acid hydroxylase superfamily)